MNAKTGQKPNHPVRFAAMYATQISVRQGAGHNALRFGQNKSTFSRFKWSVQASQAEGLEIQGGLLIRVPAKTQVFIGIKGDTPLPAGQPIPDDTLVGSIEIEFALEYVASESMRESITQGDLEKELPREVLVRDMWPYWQEAATSLAVRTKMPPPSFPTSETAITGQAIAKDPKVTKQASTQTQPKRPRKKKSTAE
ncbi:hypothetical protein [Achromobacter aegrifaciens]|uniref:hypothetical protein n=1 Tax=Achromobacter aegrifaciens TaxID=1287736 RepID=UPI000F73C626|nr:hypothetical protein [Achromobacter aegrifaciens]